MSNYGSEIVGAARSRIGVPFRHHFKPRDLCEGGGITVDSCMERGLDSDGYDCSGLVVASLCDVLGISTSEWPHNFRHVKQLERLIAESDLTFGDVLLFDSETEHGIPRRTHIGIFVARQCVVHASGLNGVVEEGKVEGDITDIRVIPSSALMELGHF